MNEQFATAVETLRPRLTRTARRYLPSFADAEDAVQDALLSAHVHLPKFAGRASLSTWLHRIVVNESLMRLRARRYTIVPLGDDDIHVSRHASAEAVLIANEEEAQLRGWIAALSPTLRDTLLLRCKDFSIQAIAQTLGVPQGTVKARLSRAKDILRRKADA
jgi:RNA polymerase sigma-70 factor (ECF subfamily)